MASKKLTPQDKNRFLKLCVNGVKFDFDVVASPKLVNLKEDDPTCWTHFPTISAAPMHMKPEDANDVRLHPMHFDFLAAAAAGATTRQAQAYRGLPDPEDGELLHEAYRRASEAASPRGFITPSELLLAFIEVMSDEEIIELPDTQELHGKVASQRTPATAKSHRKLFRSEVVSGFLTLESLEKCFNEIGAICELLCRFKALAWKSVYSNNTPPKHLISISGGAMAELPEPIPYSSDDPELDLGPSMPEHLRKIKMTIPMHCMSNGGSGTGKTINVIVPRLMAHLKYTLNDGTPCAALIVDPKRELLRVTTECLVNQGEEYRLFVAGTHGRFKLFPADTHFSLQNRMTLLMRELGVSPEHAGDSRTWVEKAMSMARSFAMVYAITYNKTGRNIFNDLQQFSGQNGALHDDFWHSFAEVIKLLQGGIGNITWMHKKLTQLAKDLALSPEEAYEFQLLSRYAHMDRSDAPSQVAYVTGGLEPMLGKLCDEGLSKWLDATPVPEVTAGSNDSYSLKALIDAGRVIVFQPQETPSGDLGTRLLKAQFNRVAMERKNLRQPILFMCDEFQRYISDDNESGEASVLDRCRAYRVTVVLATQSINALCDSLNKRGTRANPEYAVQSILANVAHHFYFQTNDPTTTQYLKSSVPPTLGTQWSHPLEVLPLGSLRVGEAYYVAPQGQWGRVQFRLNAQERKVA